MNSICHADTVMIARSLLLFFPSRLFDCQLYRIFETTAVEDKAMWTNIILLIGIPQSDLRRIHAELAGTYIYHRLQNKTANLSAVAAERTARNRVGINEFS